MNMKPTTGQIVKVSSGDYYLFHTDRLINEDGFERLLNYDDNLCNTIDDSMDIIAIYDVISDKVYNLQDLFNPDNLTLVWKRDEEEEVKGNKVSKYIRITQVSNPNFWYVDKVGAVYKVKDVDSNGEYKVKDKTDGNYGWIIPQDCIPITLGIGSKVKVKKYKGQDLYGIDVDSYKKIVEIGIEFTINNIVKSGNETYYMVEGKSGRFHESLVKPV